MNIVFASSEVAPLLKSGGLADVSRSLPRALAAAGCTVTVAIPHFPGLPNGRSVADLQVPMGSQLHDFVAHRQEIDDVVECVTLENLAEPDWGESGAYRESDSRPFIAFGRAIVEFCMAKAREVDVLHCNDWHTGHCSGYLLDRAKGRRPGTVMTIHNAAYRGSLRPADLELVGWTPTSAEPSLLAAGIAASDEVTTVSEHHRQELLTRRLGMGLEGLLSLRENSFHGIPNGFDYRMFDPSDDAYLPHPILDGDLAARRRNKKALQEAGKLEPDPSMPVLGMVSRLAEQKGVGLLLTALDEILQMNVQLVVCGVGQGYEEFFARAARHPRVAYHPSAGEDIARLTYGGSDIVLTPSRYEPFGLVPLIALRYGAMPVVRLTGGMVDVLEPLTYGDPPLAIGFRDYTSTALVDGIRRAVALLRSSDADARITRAMRLRYGWEHPVNDYLTAYRHAVDKARKERRR